MPTAKVLILGIKNFSARGIQGRSAPNILQSTRDRKLKLKTQLDIVKYSLSVQKFLPARGRQGCVGPLV